MVQKHLFECQADALGAIGEAIPRLPTPELRNAATKRFLTARDLWEATAHIRYAAEVEATFTSKAPRTYLINDQHYVWTYPKNGTRLLRSILADLDRHSVAVDLHPDLRAMLTLDLSMEGQPTIVGDKDFVSNQSRFWAAPLTDDATIDALTSLSALHAEAGDAGLCVASGSRTCPDVDALNAEVKAAEIAALRDLGIPMICSEPTSPTTSG
jgi:hypothetical protein